MARRLLLPTLLAVLLLAVATNPSEAKKKPRPPIKTIGLISIVDDKIHVERLGFFVFQRDDNLTDVSAWKLNEMVLAQLEAALKDRYQLRPVTYDRAKMKPDLGVFFSLPSPKENVRDHAKPADGQPLDAYLVVWPRRLPEVFTGKEMEGLGIFRQSGEGIYAALGMTLVDGRTFKEIDYCYLEGLMPGSRRSTSPFRVTKGVWAETYEKMTPEQKELLEVGLKDLISDGLTYCLADLKLVPEK